jgi:hypothetical protein
MVRATVVAISLFGSHGNEPEAGGNSRNYAPAGAVCSVLS